MPENGRFHWPDDLAGRLARGEARVVARAITALENALPEAEAVMAAIHHERFSRALVLGVTGPPGAGKSPFVNALIRLVRRRGVQVGVIAVDPASPVSGGAILGDRVRMMEHSLDPGVMVRSLSNRGALGGLCAPARSVAAVMATAGCRLVIVETVGVGQSEMDIAGLADISILVTAPGLGDGIQAMKAGAVELMDLLVVNKADLPGAEAAAAHLAAGLRRGGHGGEPPVLLVSAVGGQGMEALWRRVALIEERRRADGRHARARREGARREIIGWALELCRRRLVRVAGEVEFDRRLPAMEQARGLIRRLAEMGDEDWKGNGK